jgi:hypothetical protein
MKVNAGALISIPGGIEEKAGEVYTTLGAS